MATLIPREINTYTRRSLWGIAVMSALAQSMAGTFLSYFGVTIGVQKWEQSIIVSSSNLGNSFFQPYWGRLSDTFGRRPFIVIGALTMALLNAVLLFITQPIFLIGIVILESTIGIMFFPAWMGLIGDCSSQASRGRLIGWLSFLGLIISVIGLIICGLLMDSASPWLFNVFTFPFVFSMFTWLLVGLLGAIGIRQPKKERLEFVKKQGVFSILKNATRPFQWLLVVSALYQISMAALWPLVPFLILAVAESSDLLGVWTQVAMIWVFFTIPQAFFSPIGGWLGDKVSRKTAIIVFRAFHFLIPLFYLSSLLTGNYLILLIGGAISGVAIGGGDTNVNSLAIDLAPDKEKASYIAMLSFVAGLVGFASALGSGIITDFLEHQSNSSTSSVEILSFMLLGIALLRFIAWLSHLLLRNPPRNDIGNFSEL